MNSISLTFYHFALSCCVGKVPGLLWNQLLFEGVINIILEIKNAKI